MRTIRTIITLLALAAIVLSCEKKDDQIHITVFEDQLHKAVNAYRDSAGLSTLSHNFDVLSKESKGHAEGRANGSISENQVYDDMEDRWIRVYDKWGINNVSNHKVLSGIVTGEINSLNAAAVAKDMVRIWASDPEGKIRLEGDYTVHGLGEAKASDGRTYIMHMMCKFQQ